MYKPTIGMEIHAELKTKAKMFSDSFNFYDAKPNSNVNLIDLALPGTLPKLNQEAINLALKAALALNCKINKKMHFDRKSYFYADLPKGFQITQHETPIGYDGFVEIEIDGVFKKIIIERVHIEEDTCKSIHQDDLTYLDYNRAGVPLIEIVTKPMICNEKEAMLYLEKIREILNYIDVSDVKMEEGSMRCEANVSISETNDLGTKVEIKNIGSISSVGKAIIYEIERQKEALIKKEEIVEQTRRYDEKTGTTVLMRTKENKNDYRYFPEPDLPLVFLTDEEIAEMKKTIPVLPSALKQKYLQAGIHETVIKGLLSSKELINFFEEIYAEVEPNLTGKILTSVVKQYLNKNNLKIQATKLKKEEFIKTMQLYEQKQLNNQQVSQILETLLEKEIDFDKLIHQVKSSGLDDQALLKIINKIINNNSEQVSSFQNGDERILKYFMGQIMKETKGQADPKKAQELLINELKKGI